MASPQAMVLVPTYMEAETICELIDQVRQRLPDALVVVMDDQSPDGTANLVRARYREVPAITSVVRTGVRGYGPAMREGMLRFLDSDAERLITIDADLSHDPALTVRMLERIEPDGVVIGSRYIDGGHGGSNWAAGRRLASVWGNRYVRLLTGLPISDCTSGFRCYTRGALERLDLVRLPSRGYAFLVETLYWLWRAGCPIVEVPIVYRERLFGESKLGARILAESLGLPWRLLLRRAGTEPLKPSSRG